MKPSKHLPKYALFLGLGFAIGAGTANFLAIGGDEGKAAMPTAAKTEESDTSSAALNASGRQLASITPTGALTGESVIQPTLTEDISLLETADANREETPTPEPSPAELAKALPAHSNPAQRISQQETDALESKLREAYENPRPVQTEGNDGLLEHERP